MLKLSDYANHFHIIFEDKNSYLVSKKLERISVATRCECDNRGRGFHMHVLAKYKGQKTKATQRAIRSYLQRALKSELGATPRFIVKTIVNENHMFNTFTYINSRGKACKHTAQWRAKNLTDEKLGWNWTDGCEEKSSSRFFKTAKNQYVEKYPQMLKQQWDYEIKTMEQEARRELYRPEPKVVEIN